MVLERRYELGDEETLDRMRALVDYWVGKHGVRADWRASEVTLAGKSYGVKFDGVVRIGHGAIRAEMSAGFLAEKLGAPAYVERKLDDCLDPRKTVAELRARIPR